LSEKIKHCGIKLVIVIAANYVGGQGGIFAFSGFVGFVFAVWPTKGLCPELKKQVGSYMLKFQALSIKSQILSKRFSICDLKIGIYL